jgi:ABC-type dipeptide/oligopeptide/nickel transport system permease component
LGKEIVEALNNWDYVIMGSVLVISATFVVINILVDIIYAYLDPKNQTVVVLKFGFLFLENKSVN